MKKILFTFFFSLLSSTVCACPEALRYGDPCIVVEDTGYQSPHVCTQPLAYDGACLDYAMGGCALTGTCEQQRQQQQQSVLFTDNKQNTQK
jgi:hypothetical protein